MPREGETTGYQEELSNHAIMDNLLLLLDRLTTGVWSNPLPRNTSTQIIESLSTTIKEFHHNPGASMTFDQWISKYEYLFRTDGKELNNVAKIHLLLRSLSMPVYEKFLNHLWPRHPQDFTFEEVVQKLKSIFGHHKTQFSHRYDCLRTVKNEAHDYVTYASIVNRQCEDFQLSKLTVDQFKGLVFICGLQSPKDADVRTRLLSKLEAEAGEVITLEALDTESQRLASLEQDTPKPSGSQSSENPHRTPLWQYGSMHFITDGPFGHHLSKPCYKARQNEMLLRMLETLIDDFGLPACAALAANQHPNLDVSTDQTKPVGETEDSQDDTRRTSTSATSVVAPRLNDSVIPGPGRFTRRQPRRLKDYIRNRVTGENATTSLRDQVCHARVVSNPSAAKKV